MQFTRPTARILFSLMASVAFLALATPAWAEAVAAVAATSEGSVIEWIDGRFHWIVERMGAVLFYPPFLIESTTGAIDWFPPLFGPRGGEGVPLVVFVLFGGGLGFTLYNRFINVRGFRHAIEVVKGKYDNPNDAGEISHFQALTSALSATVGLGNIAGVAVAVGLGGPGAVFWMLVVAVLGMTSKFVECTLAQMYRQIDSDGTVHGGPMYYLSIGLGEKGGLFVPLGKVIALIFAVFCIGGSLGGGNMFQANQAWQQLSGEIPFFADGIGRHVFGIAMALMVGVVIIGGIQRIGEVTSKIVPFMCGGYILVGMLIVLGNLSEVPAAIGAIVSGAFSMEAGVGGFLGVLVTGVQRAVFSNEAGVGSAAIAHSAARTEHPVREGIVASLGPFIDTIVVCLMTAIVVIVTGAWNNPEAGQGVSMTSWAFGSVFPWFPKLLSVAVLLFAYSTMVSWSYYGEKATAYLFGRSAGVQLGYRVLFLFFVYLGTITSLKNVIEFSDLMILSMAFPNILGASILAPRVLEALNRYWAQLQAGEFKIYH